MSLLAKVGTVARRVGPSADGTRQQLAGRATIPAPLRGLNTRDSFATMKPDYAIRLDNYFPDHGAVRLRNGYRAFAVDAGSSFVETLIPHYSGDTEKFFCIGGGDLYDITPSGGSFGHSAGDSLKGSLTSNRWSHASISGHTVLVSIGADLPIRIEQAGAVAAAHGWTGLDDTALMELNTVTPFKNRLFFTRLGSPIIYYGPLNGVQGALSGIDLSFISAEGGNALQIGTMTIDSGRGIDDLFVVFMEHGIVLLYRGIDPSTTDDSGFFLVGQFKIGELIGDRPLVNVGGDLFAHTVDGVMSMTELLKRGRSGQRGVSVSEAIAPTIREQASIYGTDTGWDSILHPPSSWLLFSAPVPGGEQFVMNTQTGAWSRFLGMDARCWGRFQDRLFFGGSGGTVYEANNGANDAGTAIRGEVQKAYNYLKTPQDKRISLARSVIESDATIGVQLGSTTDFGLTATLATPVTLASDAASWDTAEWDRSPWAGGGIQLREWKSIDQIGSAISIRMVTETTGANVALFATDVTYEVAEGI